MVKTLNELMELKHTCKVYNKLEGKYLNFEYEYTLSDKEIDLLEDNDVDVSKYQTESSKIKEKLEEEHWIIDSIEHLKNCKNNYCINLYEYKNFKGYL